MHIITLSTFLSLITLPFTLALPTNSSTNTTLTPPSRYYLKTAVLDNGNADKNDLYVSSYHTGPFKPISLPPLPPLPPSFLRSHKRKSVLYIQSPTFVFTDCITPQAPV